MIEPNFEKFKSQVTKLENDIEISEKKHGANARWVIEKKQLMQDMIDFHDECVDYKVEADNLIELTSVNVETYRLIQTKMEYDMPWKKVFRLMGMKTPLVFDVVEQALDFLKSVDDFGDFKDGELMRKFLMELLTETE